RPTRADVKIAAALVDHRLQESLEIWHYFSFLTLSRRNAGLLQSSGALVRASAGSGASIGKRRAIWPLSPARKRLRFPRRGGKPVAITVTRIASPRDSSY